MFRCSETSSLSENTQRAETYSVLNGPDSNTSNGDPAFRRAFGNTLILNFAYLVVRFPLTLIFALLLNEIKWLPWKKFVQTVSYLPSPGLGPTTAMLRTVSSAVKSLSHLFS